MKYLECVLFETLKFFFFFFLELVVSYIESVEAFF